MKAFTQPLHDLSEYDQIVSDLAGQRTPIHIDGCIDSQKCHLNSSIGEPYPFKLIVTYNEIKAKEIYEAGVYVNPVLPPACNPGECLLRTSYMASLTEALIDKALDQIAGVLKEA